MADSTEMETNTLDEITSKLRTIHCELNPLTRVDGSALFALGATCAIASLTGPVEVKPQNMSIEKAYVECVYRPKAGLPTVKDKMRESFIRDACDAAMLTSLFPRTAITIQIQELDDRCGLEACAINAACAALLISGVPMKFPIAAVHCIIDKDGQLVLDPDRCQMLGSLASFTFVFDSLEHNIVSLYTNGSFKIGQFNSAELLCRNASDLIFDFYRKIITNFHNKSLLTADANQDPQPKESKSVQMES